MPRDVHHHRTGDLPEQRNLFGKESLQSDIRQSNRIEHSAARFNDARRFIAEPFFPRDRLGHEAAELAQVHKISVFEGVSTRPRAGHRGIGQVKTGEVYGEIAHGDVLRDWRLKIERIFSRRANRRKARN
jgi:hypothetical protein